MTFISVYIWKTDERQPPARVSRIFFKSPGCPLYRYLYRTMSTHAREGRRRILVRGWGGGEGLLSRRGLKNNLGDLSRQSWQIRALERRDVPSGRVLNFTMGISCACVSTREPSRISRTMTSRMYTDTHSIWYGYSLRDGAITDDNRGIRVGTHTWTGIGSESNSDTQESRSGAGIGRGGGDGAEKESRVKNEERSVAAGAGVKKITVYNYYYYYYRNIIYVS